MKKTSKRLRSLFAALAALMLAVILTVPAFAVEGGFADLYYRMNDSAEVLTEDEDNELEASLEELSVRQSFDVVIATIESLESVDYDSMEAYADDLYDYCQFGYGPDMDGVLLLVSVGDRKWHISTCGRRWRCAICGRPRSPAEARRPYRGRSRTDSNHRGHRHRPPCCRSPRFPATRWWQ